MMKRILASLILVMLAAANAVICKGQTEKTGSSAVVMGVARINITPEVPIPMSGYDARKTPFTGVHDSLFASAFYFKSQRTSLLLITADVIGYNKQFVTDTRNLIAGAIGIPAENIMITAAHNHGGPVTRAYEKDINEEVDNYIRQLQKKFVGISVSASEKPVPFKMGVGKTSCDLNINRRAEFADGGIWLGRDQDKPCDHELDVIKFTGLNNNILGVLINWPCHGTASGQENYRITGDWPGAAARYIMKQAGGEIAVGVTAGASADINPIYGPGKDFNEIEAVGYHVGKEACKIFDAIDTYPVESIDVINTSLTLPGKKQTKNQFPQESYESAPDVEIGLISFRIGKLVLAGISGEVMNEIGTNIKKQSPYTETTIITHCNGSSGYICTDKAFSEGGYEVKVSHLMPGAEKPLIDKILEMIRNF
jgi:neutral ceramidase